MLCSITTIHRKKVHSIYTGHQSVWYRLACSSSMSLVQVNNEARHETTYPMMRVGSTAIELLLSERLAQNAEFAHLIFLWNALLCWRFADFFAWCSLRCWRKPLWCSSCLEIISSLRENIRIAGEEWSAAWISLPDNRIGFIWKLFHYKLYILCILVYPNKYSNYKNINIFVDQFYK